MYSRDHLLVSLGVGGVAVAVLGPARPWLLVGLAAAVGVGIDFDHFLWARYNTGEWRALRRVLRDPRLAVAGQDRIFDDADLGPLQRLLSHAVLAGAAVAVLWPWPDVAAVVGLSLYAHVVADLVADVRDHGVAPDGATG